MAQKCSAWFWCSKFDHEVKVLCFHPVREEEGTFLGMRGMKSISFCPCCGERKEGFHPFAGELGRIIEERKEQTRQMRMSYGIDDDEYDEPDDKDDDKDDSDKIVVDLNLDPDASLFRCKVCGEKFKVKSDKAFCYFCGNETEKVEE